MIRTDVAYEQHRQTMVHIPSHTETYVTQSYKRNRYLY